MMLLKQLKNPYPINLNRWNVVLFISIFIPLFLIIFQPFGMKDAQIEYKYLLILGHGLATFSVLIINVFLLPATFKTFFSEKNWTILKQVFWFLWNVTTIGSSNYFLANFITSGSGIQLSSLIYFIIITLAISIIPVSFLTIISYNRFLRKNLSVSQEINNQLKNQLSGNIAENIVIIHSENKKNKLETTDKKLLFIESTGNYVKVWVLENNKMLSKTIRNTIKNIDNQLSDKKYIIKSHRAFIVNVRFIEKVEGNSQGYRLIIKHSDKKVIVARNYINEIKKAIANIALYP